MSDQTNPVTVIAIPACNEAGLIGACLEAIDSQIGAQADHVVLLANNCTDDTVAIARSIKMQHGTTLHVIEMTLPPENANAGHARRVAMQCAAALARTDGILLTTDADSRVDPDWLAANLAVIAAGADVACGWVELDPIDWGRIPAALHEDDARECAYDYLCDTLHAVLDPDPADPLPRHTQHSGASIAVTAAAFARCGGVPDVASGEDRALIAALRRVDAKIRHALEIRVVVSGRTEGRSLGGMADTIRRRLSGPDVHLDERLEPALHCALRAISRQELRTLYKTRQGVDAFAARLGLNPLRLRSLMHLTFGEAWIEVEAESPVLRHRMVPVSTLPAEMAAAEAILANLRLDDRSGNLLYEAHSQA